jgi:DNA topoisomerase-3
MPEEINPAWKSWGYDILIPEGRRFDFRPSEGAGRDRKLADIKAALEKAKNVIIATDCDREGEGIGRELLIYHDFKGTVMRIMFSAEDKKTIKKAFKDIKPSSEYDALYDAFYARAAVDKANNLTLTRAVTVRFRKPGAKGAIGVGRVMSPTLAIICRRQKEIEAFDVRDFYEIAMSIKGENGAVTLHYRPKGDGRIYEAEKAAAVVEAAKIWTGPVKVTFEHKKTAPPKFFDLPTLQKEANKKGFTASRTLEIAQSLYERHKIITYPRAAVRSLPENMADEAQKLLEEVKKIETFSNVNLEKAIVRKDRAGYYSDKALKGESHHALIPNISMCDQFVRIYDQLDADHKDLFDIIAKSFLAAISEDHAYDQTTLSADLLTEGQKYTFNEIGKITRHAGWKDLFPEDEIKAKKSKKKDVEISLPPLNDGEIMQATSAKSTKKKTSPPKAYSEGELINAMQNAWKFVENEEERDRLKTAKGIGTPATRDQIIENLKQKSFEIKKKKIHATKYGMRLFDLLEEFLPTLVDPGATARMEMLLDSIQLGENTAEGIFDQSVQDLMKMVKLIRSSYHSTELTKNTPPSDKMLSFARDLAKGKKIDFPKDAVSDYTVCKLFIDNNTTPKNEDGSPSEKQLAFAQKLSAETKTDIPEEVVKNAQELSKWIDIALKKAPPRPASPNQLVWIKKMVEQGEKPPAGYPDKVTAPDAGKFLDAAFAKNKRSSTPISSVQNNSNQPPQSPPPMGDEPPFNMGD